MKFRALASSQNEGRLNYQLRDLVPVVIWPLYIDLFDNKFLILGKSHLTEDFSEELYLVATAWLEPGNHGFKVFTSCSLLSNSTIQCYILFQANCRVPPQETQPGSLKGSPPPRLTTLSLAWTKKILYKLECVRFIPQLPWITRKCLKVNEGPVKSAMNKMHASLNKRQEVSTKLFR